MKKSIQVINRCTKEMVKELDVTGKTERQIEKLKKGISINLNHEKYFIQIKEILK